MKLFKKTVRKFTDSWLLVLERDREGFDVGLQFANSEQEARELACKLATTYGRPVHVYTAVGEARPFLKGVEATWHEL